MNYLLRTGLIAAILTITNVAYVDVASALCTQYSGESESPSKDIARTNARRILLNTIEKVPGAKSCKPLRVKCGLTGSTGWTCTARRDCCYGKDYVQTPTSPSGKSCKTIRVKAKKGDPNRKNIVPLPEVAKRRSIKAAQKSLQLAIAQFKTTYGQAICQPSRVSSRRIDGRRALTETTIHKKCCNR